MTAIRKTRQASFPLRVAALLNVGAALMAPHVAERLRTAREEALKKARAARGAARRLLPSRGPILAMTMGVVLPFFSSPAAAADYETPRIDYAISNAPAMITLRWVHSGEGVLRFDLYQGSPDGYRRIPPNYRIWTVSELQPSHTYRYRVCAVYGPSQQSCSDEDGVGWTSVTTMQPEKPRDVRSGGTQQEPELPPWAPRPIPKPVLKATWSKSNLGTLMQVRLTWANRVNDHQMATLSRIDWYRNGAFINSTARPELDDPRTDPNATTRYMLCVENTKSRVCSNEVTVAPVQYIPPPTVKPGPSRARDAILAAMTVCKSGYVWREARPSDLVCVTPNSRAIVANENRNAAQGYLPGTANSCRPGLVWRDSFNGDGVCVTPQRRAEVHAENSIGPSLRAQ